MPTIYDVVVPHYEYTDDQGKIKTKWLTCGRVIEHASGLSLKIDCVPTTVCAPGQGNGVIAFDGWFKLFETRPHSANARAPQSRDQQGDQPLIGDDIEDQPF